MPVDTSVLEDIGLTNAQIKVYVTLLELGETSSGPLLKKSKLHNSVAYHALDQLIEKGLVAFVLKGKRKYFSAEHPKSLIKFINDKKEKISQLITQLTIKPTKQEAKVFVGWKGVYVAFN